MADDYAQLDEFANACFVEAEDAVALAKALGFEDDEITVGKDGAVTAAVGWFNKQATFKTSPDGGVAIVEISATLPGLSGLRDASPDAVSMRLFSGNYLRQQGLPQAPQDAYVVVNMDLGGEDKGFLPDYDEANAAVVNFFYKVSDLRDKRKAAFAQTSNKPKTPKPGA